MNPLKTSQSLATTIARIIIGIIFFAHGWQKLFINGMDGTKAFFESINAPAPGVTSWLAALAELIGGAALILGVAVPLVSLILIINMIGAIFLSHIDAGFWNSDGGYEFPLALIGGLIAVAVASQGNLSVDGHLGKRFARDRNPN